MPRTRSTSPPNSWAAIAPSAARSAPSRCHAETSSLTAIANDYGFECRARTAGGGARPAAATSCSRSARPAPARTCWPQSGPPTASGFATWALTGPRPNALVAACCRRDRRATRRRLQRCRSSIRSSCTSSATRSTTRSSMRRHRPVERECRRIRPSSSSVGRTGADWRDGRLDERRLRPAARRSRAVAEGGEAARRRARRRGQRRRAVSERQGRGPAVRAGRRARRVLAALDVVDDVGRLRRADAGAALERAAAGDSLQGRGLRAA